MPRYLAECVHCHAVRNKIKNHSVDKFKISVAFAVTTSQLTRNISKKPLPVVMTAAQLVTKT